MSVNYTLVENLLTDRSDDFRAIATTDMVVDEKFLVDFLAQRGNTSTTHYLAVVNELNAALKYFVENGYSINLPFLQVNYSISGVFESAADTFDSSRHQLNLLAHLGKELRRVDISKIHPNKHQVTINQALISQVLDVASQQSDSTLTPGNMLQIIGNLIKVDGENAQVNGVYFVNQATQEELKVSFLAVNSPKQIVLLIPPLAAGNYNVKILTQFSGGGNYLKTTKVIHYDRVLTVY
ncbi:MAG: DUF4469 domain-containing protein [Bacteroidales bacterium]